MLRYRVIYQSVHGNEIARKQIFSYSPINNHFNLTRYPFLTGIQRIKQVSNDVNVLTQELNSLDSEILKLNRQISPDGNIYIRRQPNPPKFPKDIKPYVNELKLGTYWDSNMIEIFSEIWKKSYNLGLGSDKFYLQLKEVSKEDWVWSNTDISKNPFHLWNPYLTRWREERKCNFSLIFKLLKNAHIYQIEDYSLLNYYLIERRDTLHELREYDLTDLTEEMESLRLDVARQNEIELIGLDRFIEKIEPYDFSQVFNDQLSIRCLQSMNKFIQKTEGAFDWLLNDGNIFSPDPIWQKHYSDPEIGECGHSGASMSWTISTLRTMYRDGWKNWVRKVLLDRGIGTSN